MSIPIAACNFCGTTSHTSLIPTQSWFMPDRFANLCFSCALERINPQSLNEIDRLFQYLNIPFLPNEWNKILIRAASPEAALRQYVGQHHDIAYSKLDWGIQEQRLWEQADAGLQDLAIDELAPAKYAQLAEEWGDLPEKALRQLESLYCNSLQDYDVQTTQQRDLLKKMSHLAYLLDAQLQNGIIDKDMMTAYNNLLSTVSKQLEVASGGANMSSLSELVEFIERNGFKPNPQIDVPLDEIDLIESNLFDYQRALINNDPNIAELYHQRKRLRDQRAAE